jgi:predicted O-linked N-acetylglucosamine transferase (SPINDLY family)
MTSPGSPTPARRSVSGAALRQWQRLQQAGRGEDCLNLARQLVASCGNDGKAWQLLGLSHFLRGEIGEALQRLARAAQLSPADGSVWDSLGLARQEAGDAAGAREAFRRAVLGAPRSAGILVNAAAHALVLGDAEDSLRLANRAIVLAPALPEAQLVCGNALSALGRSDDALAAFRHALALRPRFGQAALSLGRELAARGRHREACDVTRRAIELQPDFAEAHVNLGGFLHMLSDVAGAAQSYARAVALMPQLAGARSGYLFCRSQDPTVSQEVLFAEHRAFGEWVEAPWRAGWGGHVNERNGDRRLRLGFVSGDLRDHPVARYIEPVWQALDRTSLEIVAYAASRSEDQVSQRLRALADVWVNVSAMPDEALAARIRADRIDILCDLSGHTLDNRLSVFARKPAPVQVTLIGYPNTTGLMAMDYRLVSHGSCAPGRLDSLFTEKLVYVPCTSRFIPVENAPPVNGLPARERGHVTFGSFNRTGKQNPRVIEVWSRVLQAVPGSRLLIGAVPDDGQRRDLTVAFARHGIDASRLEFHPRVGLYEYLALHHRVDIILDTWPYTGGTTTNHALWMGVPTLTLAGPSLPQVQGAGILRRAGLAEWVAGSEEDFVARAVRLTADTRELAALRAGLRDRLREQAADRQASLRLVGEALRIMWRRWCAGLPPESFEVKP